ncbi:uncharacterized protein LOC123980427 isoform X4 [Micropterus dolomieu]|uniref:uncharacterized protein LOC123980427 isoform X4 n=1 Tax=Micropterus dolomieu TaxID=147949 RepID=UPI001E8EE013|nr:uncharacterized protein LOC123980427 isoform X4 [Micropterus dolomieu]
MSHPLDNPYASGNQSSTQGHNMQSIPVLGDYDCAEPDKLTESSRPKHTSESAANILLRYGLEKEDLDHLMFYPEDQLTPDNLPFILRQIRIQKAKSATSAVQSVPFPEPQPTRSVSEMDSHSLSSSRGAGMSQEQMSTTALQPSKVTEYGPTGKYGGVGDEIGRTGDSRANSGGSGSIFRHSQEPLQNITTEVKSTALGSSCEQASSVTSLSSSYSSVLSSVAPPRNDPDKQLQTQPNQTQTILSFSSLLKKDTDIRVLKTEDSKPGPSNEPVADRQSVLKTGSDRTSGIKDQSKTQGQDSTVAEEMKKQQTQQTQKQPSLQTGQEIRPPVFPAAKLVPPEHLIPSITDGSQAMQCPVFIPTRGPPALPQPIPDHMTLLTSNRQPPLKVAVSKALPSLAMIHDYVAVWPKIFPHTCSLCNKDFHHMKDWLSHQSTSLHLENCKLLRKQYPDWNGGIALGPRTAGKDVKLSASTSAKTSQHRLHKTRHGSSSRSCSSSPRRPHGSEVRREKCSSRSRSSHSSRSNRRSRSRSHSPCYDRQTSSCYRSCLGSPERQLLPRRRDKKWSTPRKNDEQRSSPSKSCERHSPPRRRDERRSPPRRSEERQSASSTSDEKQLPPRRSDKKCSPRRNDERQSSSRKSKERQFTPRKSEKRWSPPRRSNNRWFLPRRSDNRRWPQRRSRERRSSTEESSPKRKKSSSAERLAKKLLETSAVQSLSNQSDLEAVVKALAPALLAELGKMKSSSSSFSTAKGESSTDPSKATPSLQKSVPSSATKTKETDSKEQKQPPQKKPATSGDATPQTATSTTTSRKVVLKKAARGKLASQKIAAKASVKGTAFIKSVVCVSKAKNIITKQMAKTAKTGKCPVKGAVKKTVVKHISSKSTAQGKMTKTESSQMQPQAAGRPAEAAVEAKLPAFQSLSKQSAPDLRDELDKMRFSSSSSTAKEESSVDPSKATPSLQKSVPSSTTTTKSGKSSLPTTVRIEGISSCVPRNDVIVSLEHFGKTKSIVLFESQREQATGQPTEAAEEAVLPGGGVETKTVQKAVQSLSEQSHMEAVVKALAPDLRDELDKMKFSSSSSSSYTAKEESSVDPHKATPSLQKSVPSSTTTKFGKSSPPTMVRLKEICSSLSHSDVIVAVEHFGKTKSVLLFRSKLEAIVCFEKAEDANKLKSAKSLNVKGTVITVVREKETDSKEQRQPAQKPPLKEPLPSGAKEATTSKLTKTEASQMQQQAARHPAEAAVEAKMPGRGLETNTVQKDPVAAGKTQTDAASAKAASLTSEPTAAAVREQLPAVSTLSSAVTPLTLGEMVEKHLDPKRIMYLKLNSYTSPDYFKYGKKLLLITGLPEYHDGRYTEDELAELLKPFGFQHKDDTIYVVPQTCMAFVMMPTVKNVLHTMRAVRENGIYFKGSTLHAHVICSFIANTPFGFYESLMKLMKSRVVDDGVRTVLIKNISQSEIRDLREALKKVSSIRNYLPLLNKLFIEFESVCDADRFGVWHSLLKQAPRHKVHRLKIPNTCYRSPPPRFPENALPDIKDVVFGATIPLIKNIPQDSISPFWVTMRTSPFLFPTLSPWFIIPDYLTVRRKDDIEKASGSKFPTIMLTGLPEGNYQHEDVAKLVWRYFPKQNLRSLYYNVTVLTLQRRAFVFFADWTTCCDFVRDHLKNPVSVKFCTLSVHFVLQDMNPESSEERMYRSLMKWSNAGVPELKSLEERLLCVEFSHTSVALIRKVIEVVASIASFVSFLPLANRICIEMADSSGVTQVVKFAPAFFEKQTAWMKVKSFEPLKSLKERLRDSTEFTINFQTNTISVKAKPPAVKCHTHSRPSKLFDTGSQAALPTSGPGGSNISEPVTAGPSANKKRSPGNSNTSSRTAAAQDAPQRMDEDDFTDDSVSAYLPIAYLFDEQNFCGCRTPTRLSSTAHEREKITSAATVKSSREAHPNPLRQETQDTESAVAKSDHKVSAEGNAAKTVASQTKIETSSEMRPPPHGHEVGLSQTQSLDADCNVNTLKDQKKRKQEGKEDVDKHSEVEEDDRENYQILDSLDDQTDEQMDNGDQHGSSETQLTGPEGSQTLHEEKGIFHLEEDSEMETTRSLQVLDSVTEDQAAAGQEDSRLVQDDGSTVKQLSEEDANPVVDKSDDAVKDAVGKETDNKEQFQVLVTGSKQGPKGDGKKKEQKEEEVKVKTLSAESSKTSKDVENPDGRIPNEDQLLQECDSKDNLKGPASDVTEEETFEMLDSINDQTATLDDNQKHETPSEQISKEFIRPEGEEEDTDLVTDTVKDRPMKSKVDDKEKSTKKEEATPRKDERQSKRSDPATSASKSEEKEKSQDKMVKKYETQTKMGISAAVSKKDKEVTEEVVYEVVDSVENEVYRDASATERSGRRRSARGKKVNENADDELTIMRRSTRVKRERTTNKDASIEKTQKEDTPTRRRHAPARESQERSREKTPKRESKVPLKESTPTKKDIAARKVSEDDANCEISSMEDGVVKHDQPATGGGVKGKRGRPKKPVQTTKKDKVTLKADEDSSEKVADEAEATYLTLNSVEKRKVDDQLPTGQSAKRKHVNDSEESMNFVTVDEVGEVELEEEEEEKVVTPRTRGRTKKRSRQTPAVSKQRAELVEPETKRSCSRSHCVSADYKLPAFKPNNPLGQDFVVPTSGYFCNLCFDFYKSTAKDLHCSSQRHYDNLQKHYQKLQQKPSRCSTQSAQGSVSE